MKKVIVLEKNIATGKVRTIVMEQPGGKFIATPENYYKVIYDGEQMTLKNGYLFKKKNVLLIRYDGETTISLDYGNAEIPVEDFTTKGWFSSPYDAQTYALEAEAVSNEAAGSVAQGEGSVFGVSDILSLPIDDSAFNSIGVQGPREAVPGPEGVGVLATETGSGPGTAAPSGISSVAAWLGGLTLLGGAGAVLAAGGGVTVTAYKEDGKSLGSFEVDSNTGRYSRYCSYNC